MSWRDKNNEGLGIIVCYSYVAQSSISVAFESRPRAKSSDGLSKTSGKKSVMIDYCVPPSLIWGSHSLEEGDEGIVP